MALDDINGMFAKLAGMIDETDATKNPKELAAVTAGLALARTIVTDLRRIADSQEIIADEAKRSYEAYREALKKR